MKYAGIVKSAKSARKHRRAGHYVTHLMLGGWAWSHPYHIAGAKLEIDPATTERRDFSANEICKVFSTAEVRALRDCITRVNAQGAAVPDVMRGAIVTHTPSGVFTISVGARFWPRRRNQHSKQFIVLGFMAGTNDVMFCRDGDTTADSMSAVEFLKFVGKQVQA